VADPCQPPPVGPPDYPALMLALLSLIGSVFLVAMCWPD
jgi:hypothetical protein